MVVPKYHTDILFNNLLPLIRIQMLQTKKSNLPLISFNSRLLKTLDVFQKISEGGKEGKDLLLTNPTYFNVW